MNGSVKYWHLFKKNAIQLAEWLDFQMRTEGRILLKWMGKKAKNTRKKHTFLQSHKLSFKIMILESQSQPHSWAFHRRTSAAVRTCPYLGFRLEFHFFSAQTMLYNLTMAFSAKAEISLATAALFKFRFPPATKATCVLSTLPLYLLNILLPKDWHKALITLCTLFLECCSPTVGPSQWAP